MQNILIIIKNLKTLKKVFLNLTITFVISIITCVFNILQIPEEVNFSEIK